MDNKTMAISLEYIAAVVHPPGTKMRKNDKLEETEKRLGKCSYLAHPGVRGCLWVCRNPKWTEKPGFS